MVMSALNAVSAYKKSDGLFEGMESAASAPASGGEEFGKMVKGFMNNAVSSLHEGEKAAAAAASGKADLASVVTAMDNAEIVLTEITAIRDKVINAYQTIVSSTI